MIPLYTLACRYSRPVGLRPGEFDIIEPEVPDKVGPHSYVKRACS